MVRVDTQKFDNLLVLAFNLIKFSISNYIEIQKKNYQNYSKKINKSDRVPTIDAFSRIVLVLVFESSFSGIISNS